MKEEEIEWSLNEKLKEKVRELLWDQAVANEFSRPNYYERQGTT